VARGAGVGQLPIPAGVATLGLDVVGKLIPVLETKSLVAKTNRFSRFRAVLCLSVRESLLNRRSGKLPTEGIESGSGCQSPASGAGSGNASHNNSLIWVAISSLALVVWMTAVLVSAVTYLSPSCRVFLRDSECRVVVGV
jgi:hypothetical protein